MTTTKMGNGDDRDQGNRDDRDQGNGAEDTHNRPPTPPPLSNRARGAFFEPTAHPTPLRSPTEHEGSSSTLTALHNPHHHPSTPQ